MKQNKQNLGRFFWLLAILFALYCYIRYPESFRAEGLAAYMQQYHEQALLIYFAISMLRGFFLIPSTPFVLAGVLMFPDAPLWVFVISMLGVLFGCSVVYWFSERLGFGDTLRKKHEGVYLELKDKMEHYGVSIVILWSFFPLVPTDLICCIAGTIRMSFARFVLAVFIGEFFLILGYIYTGKALLSYVFDSF